MTTPRLGLVGARRRRQGLGPYVARELQAAGAEVACFLTTSPATLESAARQLEEQLGNAPRGYLDLAAMLDAERLDALAILSPAETHRVHLEAAAAAGLHVLCEKPLVWGEADLAGTASRIVRSYVERGLLLRENCQWPFTLPAFAQLHPGALDSPPRAFEMRLQPTSTGLQMLGDCLPHVLSLLQALVPGRAPELDAITGSASQPAAERTEIRFRYRCGGIATEVRATLVHSDRFPREAAYAIDGRWAERLVSMPGYRLRFAANGREVPLADPLKLRIAAFVRELAAPDSVHPTAEATEIAERMRLLATVVEAWGRGGASGGTP